MKQLFFVLALCAVTYGTAQHSPVVRTEYPRQSSRHFSVEQILTGCEVPFIVGTTAPSWPFFALGSGHHTPHIECLFTKEVFRNLFGIAKLSTLALAHLELFKAVVNASQYNAEVASFFKTKPVDARYRVTVLMELTRRVEENSVFRHIITTQEETFEGSDASALLQDIVRFVDTWTLSEKNKTPRPEIFITLTSSVANHRGKPFVFAPQCLRWDDRVGIERDLRELLLPDLQTHPEKTLRETGFALLCAGIALLMGKCGL